MTTASRSLKPIFLVLLALSIIACGSGEPSPKILVIGLDGADWDILRTLMENGRTPTLSKLTANGASYYLESEEPLISPPIWTTIATGTSRARHGITHFYVQNPTTQKIMPVTSLKREVPAIWNWTSHHDRTVGVVGWWATWPSEEVNGRMVSDHFAYHNFFLSAGDLATTEGRTYPAALADEIEPLTLKPDTLVYEDLLPFFGKTEMTAGEAQEAFPTLIQQFKLTLATTKTYQAITGHLLAENVPDLFMLYIEGTDSVGHLFMPYTPPKMAGVDERAYALFHPVIERYYVMIDRVIGELLAHYSEDDLVVLLSDHGFAVGSERAPFTHQPDDVDHAHLWHTLDGILILSGNTAQKSPPRDEMPRASIYDIVPTLLYALDLPVPQDLEGNPLVDAFQPSFRQNRSVKKGLPLAAEQRSAQEINVPVESEIYERLSSLGYTGSDSADQHINRGIAYEEEGSREQAKTEFENALALDPDNAKANFNLAVLAEKEGSWQTALEYLDKAVAADPLYAAAFAELGVTHYQLGDWEESQKAFERALQLDPTLQTARRNYDNLLEQLEN